MVRAKIFSYINITLGHRLGIDSYLGHRLGIDWNDTKSMISRDCTIFFKNIYINFVSRLAGRGRAARVPKTENQRGSLDITESPFLSRGDSEWASVILISRNKRTPAIRPRSNSSIRGKDSGWVSTVKISRKPQPPDQLGPEGGWQLFDPGDINPLKRGLCPFPGTSWICMSPQLKAFPVWLWETGFGQGPGGLTTAPPSTPALAWLSFGSTPTTKRGPQYSEKKTSVPSNFLGHLKRIHLFP